MLELCPMSSDFHLYPLYCLFDQSHVTLPCSIACIPMCFITLFFLHGQAHSFQILTRRGILFFFNSVVALRISSRLSPWRSRRFHFKEEALTASVRRSYATFMADTTCSGWRTGQHPSWPRPVCKRICDNMELQQKMMWTGEIQILMKIWSS